MHRSFFCPDCDDYVSSPHFCPVKGGPEAPEISFQIDLTRLMGGVPEAPGRFTGVPEEYARALDELELKLETGKIESDEYEAQRSHIERLIALWRRFNGKEQPDD